MVAQNNWLALPFLSGVDSWHTRCSLSEAAAFRGRWSDGESPAGQEECVVLCALEVFALK